MAPVSETQLHEIRTRILGLSSQSVRVADVTVADAEGPEGPALLVTVRLASPGPGQEWDPDAFLEVRRQARTAALEAAGGSDVRLVYESAATGEAGEDEVEPADGKSVEDESD
jgi:hypothetical protein